MAWETKSLSADSEEGAAFLQQYPEAIETLVNEWHMFREHKYETQQPVFGYSTGDLESESFPELLSEDFGWIRDVTERQWQAAFVRTLQKTTEFLDPREHLPEYTELEEWSDESVLHDEMFFELTKYRIDIETSFGNVYTYRFDEPINNVRQVTDMAPPVLDYSDPKNPTLDIYIEDEVLTRGEVDQAKMHGKMEIPDTFFESVFPSVNLLGVYSGVLPVGFFEVRNENQQNAKNVFDMLGFKSVELGTQYNMVLFAITYSDEKYAELQSLSENPHNITLSNVYELLDLPTGGAEKLEQLRVQSPTYIHIIPGLEFAVYGVQNGDIKPDLARYWPYVYYRPPFSIEGVKTALEDAEELYNALRENKNMFSQIEGDEVSPLIDDFLMTAEQNIGWPETISVIQPHHLEQKV